jgi:hypothetical protein
VTPVWFVYRDGVFWISSGERNVKIRNLRNDARTSIALQDGDRPAVAEGRAQVHDAPLRADVLASLAGKYGGWDAGVEVTPFGRRVLIEVPVGRWLLKGAAA